jgi:hypothetical protein
LNRRNLVIVRAGDDSLHPRWLRGGAERSWDLVVSYFGGDPNRFREPDSVRIDGKGPKWPALQTLLQSHSDLLSSYDYIWLPDDDIDCNGGDIDRLFAAARQHKLLLCQPALTPSSYFTWVVTLQHPFARLRFTNFVEIMVPCFDRKFLTQLIPTMGENLSGWGLDFLWPRMAAGEPSRVAIVDTVAVTHTRPIGSANYTFLKARGITARDEMNALLRAHGIRDCTIRVNAIEMPGAIRFAASSWLGRTLVRAGYFLIIVKAHAQRAPNRWKLGQRLRVALHSPVVFNSPGRGKSEAVGPAANKQLEGSP